MARRLPRLCAVLQLCCYVPVVQGAVPLREELASSNPQVSAVDSGKVYSLYSQVLRYCLHGEDFYELLSQICCMNQGMMLADDKA